MLLRRPPLARRFLSLPLSDDDEEVEEDDDADGDDRRRRGGDDRPRRLGERERREPSLARCVPVSLEDLRGRLADVALLFGSAFPDSFFLAGLERSPDFFSAWLPFLSDSLAPCDDEWEEPRAGCFASLALPEAAEEALWDALAAGDDGGADPGLPDAPMLDHLTWDRGSELAVFRPDDISSGSTPGGRGSVGSSS